MLIPMGVLGASGAGAAGAYELIESTVLGSSAATISFASVPSTYKHLQIRYTAKVGTSGGDLFMTFNSDSGSNYRNHKIQANGSTIISNTSGQTTYIQMNDAADGSGTANIFYAGLIDILDYGNTSKNTTTRHLHGGYGSSLKYVFLLSGLWMNTAAVNAISFTGQSNFATGSRFSLYGIKG